MKPCIGIPIYDHGSTIAEVVDALEKFDLSCIIVDDGSHRETREELDRLEARHPWVEVVHHRENRGRGAALRSAYRRAAERGFSHLLQLDADGQHQSADIPRLLDAAVATPDALVLGAPLFDEDAPWHRIYGRKLSQGIVWLETLSFSVRDPLCGFRCIPLTPTLEVLDRSRTGDRMDFDPELVIRLVRAGVPVVNVPTEVCYPKSGISHFRMLEDNLLIAWAYIRLLFEAPVRRVGSILGREKRLGISRVEWSSASERGSKLSLRFIVWCIRRLGEAPARFLVAPIALYYCVFARTARRASRDYQEQLERFRGGSSRRPGLRDFYRHVYVFADVLADRFALWAGGHDKFEIELHGREFMQKLIDDRRGAVLIGAHLGNFDMLRVIARDAGIPVNVIMYTGNAEMLNAAFESLDPECNVRVINVDPGSVNAAFEIRSCIGRGEFVAILGDRAQLGGRTARVGYANFLGRRAPFSQGPFLISMALRLPVILSVALKTGPHRYDVFLETLASGEAVRRADRAKVVQEQIELFAAHLERFCLREPLQWFNFYDFWDGETRAQS